MNDPHIHNIPPILGSHIGNWNTEYPPFLGFQEYIEEPLGPVDAVRPSRPPVTPCAGTQLAAAELKKIRNIFRSSVLPFSPNRLWEEMWEQTRKPEIVQ